MSVKKRFSENKVENRCYNLQLRADEGDEAGIIEGVPIVFDKETIIHDVFGDFKEVIEKSALDKTDLKDVLLCINHDISKIALARSKNGKGTMTMEVKEDGLHIRAKLDIENNAEARSVYSAVQRGDMDGMSFMFRIDEDEWLDLDKDVPLRKIKSISIVHEVSIVNFPAYNQTSVNARSNSKENEASPLAEARKAYSEEAEKRNQSKLELEKVKYTYLIGGKL